MENEGRRRVLPFGGDAIVKSSLGDRKRNSRPQKSATSISNLVC